MYRTYVPRDDNYMTRLKGVIYREYNINAMSIVPAGRGYYGETWRLETCGNVYFVKLDYFPRHQNKFKDSLPVVKYLCETGIDFINDVIETSHGELCIIFSAAVLAVFEWIEGELIQTDDTKAPEYDMLCKIYGRTKQGFNIPTLEFSAERGIYLFDKWEILKSAARNSENRHVLSVFERNKERLSHCFRRLSHFASVCQNDTSNFYITHGDAGGNFIAGNGRYYIVDWDEVMYAPPERDAWVMCCHDWAVRLFNNTLEKNGIVYQLRPERLAFYCYHMLFYYLAEFMDDFLEHGKTDEIDEYFSANYWIWDRVQYADKINE